MKVVIVNAHSCHNLGDAAILITMVESLGGVFPVTDVFVISDTPDKDQQFYQGMTFLGIKYPWEGRVGAIGRIYKLSFYMQLWIYIFAKKINPHIVKLFLIGEDAAQVVNTIHDADIVVSCGGGYINSLGKLFVRLSLAVLGKVFGKKIIFYSQSVSDLRSAVDRFIVKTAINLSDKFIAREQISIDYLESIGVAEEKLELCHDSAFLLKPQSLTGEGFYHDTLQCSYVGITVTRWMFPGAEDVDALIEKYVQSIRALALHVTSKGSKLIVFPQVTGPQQYSDDRSYGREIFGPLANDNVVLLENEFTPSVLKSLISKVDVFIGTRMHSNIFALGARVPTLAIAYQDKTKGIMKMIGLEDWVIPIDGITPLNLCQKFDELWKERETIKTHLEEKLPEVEASAVRAASICLDVYRDRGTA